MKKRYLLTALVEDGSTLNELVTLLKKYDAEIEKTEDLGAKRLYVPIAKRTELTLISVFAQMEPDKIEKVNGELRHNELIKRYLLTMWKVDPNKKRSTRKKKNIIEEVKVEETKEVVNVQS